jgi:RNA polymerase sigma factor (sigma-70 family)
MPDATDMELVRQFACDNSEAAFTELVRRHINLVYSVARRCTGNDGDAHDVTQAVFIILARRATSLREKTLLTGWLYETTRFTAARLLRTNARRHAREQEAFMQSTLNETETTNVWMQLAPHLETAMGKLNASDRALLVLRFYENKSGPEAAALLGIREDAAHKRVTRAIEKLRKVFVQRGVTLSGATIAGVISANSVQAAPIGLTKTISAIAIAKGATATSSTLTLIKGALKIMAWTKAKTAVVVTVAVMLTAGTTTLVIETVHLSRVGVYQPIRDNEPEITARVRGLKMEELTAEDCTPEFWQQLHQSPLFNNPAVVKGLAAALGPLQTVTLVERTEIHGRPNYLYRMKYQKMNVLFLIVFDGEKIAFAKGYPEPK